MVKNLPNLQLVDGFFHSSHLYMLDIAIIPFVCSKNYISIWGGVQAMDCENPIADGYPLVI